MTSQIDERSGASFTKAERDLMEKYGITRVSVDYFYYKEFRYTDLNDALAQAKRQEG